MAVEAPLQAQPASILLTAKDGIIMKKLNLIVSLFLISHSAFAFIPASSITSQKVKLYAIYTTADATCQTNLVATVPMVATPLSLELTTGPQVNGSVSVSNPVNCIIAVVGNSSTLTVPASSAYTGTSAFSPTNANVADTNCAAGLAAVAGTVTNAVGNPITWPTQITTDLTAKSLTGATVTSTSTSDIIPIYISTNSKCTAQYATDKNVTGCTAYTGVSAPTTNPHAFPTAANSTTQGILLAASIASGAANGYKLVFNPANSVGGSNGGCGGGYPLASFVSR